MGNVFMVETSNKSIKHSMEDPLDHMLYNTLHDVEKIYIYFTYILSLNHNFEELPVTYRQLHRGQNITYLKSDLVLTFTLTS